MVKWEQLRLLPLASGCKSLPTATGHSASQSESIAVGSQGRCEQGSHQDLCHLELWVIGTQENSNDMNRMPWAKSTLGDWFHCSKRCFIFKGNEKNAIKYWKTSKNYPRKLYYLIFSRSLFDPQNSHPHETWNSLHGFRKCFIWKPFHVWCNNNIIKSFSLTAGDWNIIDKMTCYPEFGPTYFDRCETNQG